MADLATRFIREAYAPLRYSSYARDEFLDLLFGPVNIFVSVGELCAKLVRVALDLS